MVGDVVDRGMGGFEGSRGNVVDGKGHWGRLRGGIFLADADFDLALGRTEGGLWVMSLPMGGGSAVE